MIFRLSGHTRHSPVSFAGGYGRFPADTPPKESQVRARNTLRWASSSAARASFQRYAFSYITHPGY